MAYALIGVSLLLWYLRAQRVAHRREAEQRAKLPDIRWIDAALHDERTDERVPGVLALDLPRERGRIAANLPLSFSSPLHRGS